MRAYYNEIEPYCCAWLSNLMDAGLITPGRIDDRSVESVGAADLRGYVQCHFFAGIGVWSYALRLAGWPDEREAWTGSCPCQPFSSASHGKSAREGDERNLWPEWFRLIAERAPSVVFGEQTSQAGDWLDRVCDDMEGVGYSVGASIFPAVAVGADHARQRIYFVCDADGNGESGCEVNAEAPGMSWDRGNAAEVVRAHGAAPRMAVMRSIGNAIVPQQAQAFIEAYMECRP